MIGLLIFTAAMLAGCIFLLYFLGAIWRDAHKQRRGPRVEIIKLPSRRGFTNNKSTNLRMVAAFLVLTTVFAAPALAQETIFNVPNGDILDKGKVYGEVDFAYFWDASAGSYTPRLVVGIGHRVEVGINVNGITSPGPSQTTPTPTIKWKAYDGGKNGWAFMLGDDVFVPVQNRSYNVGNYIYGEFTKTMKTQTRVTFGAFDFTSNVVASGNKAGGQFGIEQPAGRRVTLAADWFTGHHGAGYFTPGAAIKLSSKATAYTAYEIGNSGASHGNHLLLLELGWNFN